MPSHSLEPLAERACFSGVPAVRKLCKALVKQMGALMMSEWNENIHICENYNPRLRRHRD